MLKSVNQVACPRANRESPWAKHVVGELLKSSPNGLTANEATELRQVLTELLAKSQAAHLNYLPVFGYLSLMTDNAFELGKTSQRDVVMDRDVEPARLENYALAPVASTVFRGTLHHPGLVAGLSASRGEAVQGVVLKLPLRRAQLLLARVLKRELTTENDLGPPRPGERSRLMYRPQVLPVKLESNTVVHSLVFTTNPDSPKALLEQRVFADSDNPSGQMKATTLSWLMASRGASPESDKPGATSAAYWNYFVRALELHGRSAAVWIKPALSLSEQVPSCAECGILAARALTNPAEMSRLNQVLEQFSGAAIPLFRKRDDSAQ